MCQANLEGPESQSAEEEEAGIPGVWARFFSTLQLLGTWVGADEASQEALMVLWGSSLILDGAVPGNNNNSEL